MSHVFNAKGGMRAAMKRTWPLLLLSALSAMAQTPPPATCFSQCQAPSATLAANPPPVQACLIRCRAGAEFAAASQRDPHSAYAGQGMPVGRQPPPQVASPALPVGGEQWGAIYAAAPPGHALGISHGMTDRSMVHTRAQTACRASGQAGCRMLTEFNSGCGAAAQALRARGMMITADASTYRVAFVTAANGTSRADAQARALEGCRAREPTARCRIVAAACVAP